MSAEDVEDIRKEVEILHLLTPHQYLADLKGVYEDRENVHILMEYCSGGELFDRIISKGKFSEAEAARYFREMVEMIAHCHACGVMHRDIKPENFLLSDKSEAASLLACDFGLGAFFRPGQQLSSLVGSPYYVAPEVLRRRYGNEADIWSLGVVLYILLSGIPPFWGPNDKEIFMAILRGNPDLQSNSWPKISEAAKELIRRLLTVDPSQRPTVSEMLSHPWLREHGVASDEPLDSLVIARMKKFAALTKLKKAAVLVAAQHLNHEEIHGLKELFKSFDTNGDGQISLDELRAGLRSSCAQLTDDEIEMVMRDTDVDGSGAIDYTEFLAATVNMALLEREEVLRKLFLDLDADGSGTLSVDEIEQALNKTGLGAVDHAEVLELVRRADTNGDGVVDFDEFVVEWRRKDGRVVEAAKRLKRGLTCDLDEMEIE